MMSNRGRIPPPGVREDDEGNPASLSGQLTAQDIGSAVAAVLQPSRDDEQPLELENGLRSAGAAELIEFSKESYYAEGSVYKPSNIETARAFEAIMTWVLLRLSDASHEIVVSAADSIVEVLKAPESVLMETKRQEIALLLEVRHLDDVELNELVNLAHAITDYSTPDEGEQNNNDNDAVGIVFEDDAEEEDEARNESVAEVQDSVEPLLAEQDVDTEAFSNEAVISSNVSGGQQDVRAPLGLDIDEFFLQRKVSSLLEPLENSHSISQAIFLALSDKTLSTADVEATLATLLKHRHFDFIKLCVDNRWRIVFKLREIAGEPREKLLQELKELNLSLILSEFEIEETQYSKKRTRDDTSSDDGKMAASKKTKDLETREPKVVDLQALVFDEGAHLMTNTKVMLPEGSFHQSKKLYDIISIPAPESPPMAHDETLVSIESLPEWCRCVFPSSETSTLNRIQSRVYPLAFGNDENLLLCAPTGAGKTNVAMLSILKVLNNFRDTVTGRFSLNKFKIVYIAPLKALVQEQTREFLRRLTPNFGIVVNELTGDSSLSKQQIKETQVIVTTPEKWDVITRKTETNDLVSLTKLIIVDEIHLLHDERGPVLENIISRTIRNTEKLGNNVRLVGLSATLPNYEDVSTFLRVDVSKNLFYFDASYRPCPLEQKFIGIKEKKAIKKLNAMNEACYEKVLECAKEKQQVIIFVHSRKDTHRTASWLKDKLVDDSKLDEVVQLNSGTKEILKQEASAMLNKALQEIIQHGFGIHHAGLNKDERLTVEDLFAQGHLKVLVSTATLAWGVNLPAHTVIIKGTETYSPEKGTWVQLSPQDILQMLGRAGRPRYDKSGEGVIITSNDEVQYFMAILNQQLPIESQMMSKIVDSLNAEVVLGNVRNLEDAISWLGYTYLYIRMIQSPSVYRVGADYGDDKLLYWKRADLCHSALVILKDSHLVTYNLESKDIKPTDLGVISSQFYIGYETIKQFNSKLKPWNSEIEILRVFASSGEFKYIPVRQEEKAEVSKLLERCPIPVKEKANEALAKVNVLFQSYVSGLRLEGFALMADMVYITQSGGRLLRAIYEICLRKKWSKLTQISLRLCKMVDQRMWSTSSLFRQFREASAKDIERATENSNLPFLSYFSLSSAEFAEAFNLKASSSNLAVELLSQFPKLSFNYQVQPITKTLLRVIIEVFPEWKWNTSIHGGSETFLLLVEDCDGNKILYSQDFKVYRDSVNQVHTVEFTVDVENPKQPVYFVKLLSQKWLYSDWTLSINLDAVKMPSGVVSSFTRIHDFQNIAVTALEVPEFLSYFPFQFFNKIQSQVFQTVFNSNENVFIGASKGSGKAVIAELAILNHWRQNKGRAVYIGFDIDEVQAMFQKWNKTLLTLGSRNISVLTGDVTKDFQLLASSHLTLATPAQFELLSRRWRYRKTLQQIELIILNDTHKIGSGSEGLVLETLTSRMRLANSQLENDLRIVALSVPLVAAKDLGEWLGCSKSNVYNFDPSVRMQKISEIRLQVAALNSGSSATYLGPTYSFLKDAQKEKTLIFVGTKKLGSDLALGILQSADAEEWELFSEDLAEVTNRLSDPLLKELTSRGIGFLTVGQEASDSRKIKSLFDRGYIKVFITTFECVSIAPISDNVIVAGTLVYDGKEQHDVDITLSLLLETIGCCQPRDTIVGGKSLVITSSNKLPYYRKLLNEGLPVESFLDGHLHEIFSSEISSRVFKTRQDCIDWLTFTYFYRRLQHNPSFYGLKDTSHVGISSYLSEVVSSTLEDLEESKLIELDDEDDEDFDEDEEIAPLDGAMVAGFYNVSYSTMKDFMNLNDKSKLKDILEIIANNREYDSLPLRLDEKSTLKKLYNKLPVKMANPNFESSKFKVFVLLQSYFSRIPLTSDLKHDQTVILQNILQNLNACIDYLSSEGFLNALNAMDLSQMIVQGLWNRDSPLKQIPHFTEDILDRCTKGGVETVYDLMSLEDDERDDILRMEGKDLEDVAEFVNKYPNIDISYKLDTIESLKAEEAITLQVTLERDEDMEDLDVVTSKFPFFKSESWWLVLGDSSTKQLYAVKKTTIAKEQQDVNLVFTIPNKGHHKLTVWCMCDSYMDADKEIEFEVDLE